MKRIAFTSITVNYLPKARVLAHSVKRHAPDVEFVLVVCEEVDPALLAPDDPFDRIVTVFDLSIPDVRAWLFTHTVVEACTAIKGHALVSLLASEEDVGVLYFDPDIVVTGPLDDLYSRFDAGPVLITPHGTEPETDRRAVVDNEISHLRYGVYNLGFLGVRNTRDGRRFADWWAARLHEFCFDDIEAGIFTDQRWVDLAPGLFNGVQVLRDPGFNVATWNLSHRLVAGSYPDALTSNKERLVFYHFSGFDSGAMETMLEVYGSASPVLREFRLWYVAECERMGQKVLGTKPWKYGTFEDGKPISRWHRRLYRDREDLRSAFVDPFIAAPGRASFASWCAAHQSEAARAAAPVGDPYEVVVLAWDTLGNTVELLRQLLSRTAARASVVVAAAPEVCREIDSARLGVRVVEALRECDSEPARHDWMISRAAASAVKGTIFVQLGLELPDLWDLRLYAGAQRESAVATASPLYDGHGISAIFGPTDDRNAMDAAHVDRAVLSFENRMPSESPGFVPECFFLLNHAARTWRKTIAQHGGRGTRRSPTLGDFASACNAQGLTHIIVGDLYVGASAQFGHVPIVHTERRASHDLYEQRNIHFETRNRLLAMTARDAASLPAPAHRASRRQLHLTHGWGGGLGHWIRSFCTADAEHVNMILKPVGGAGGHGSALELYADIDDGAPLGRWELPIPIKATTDHSLSYRRILTQIIKDYGIDVIMVSTLIGHSIDALRTGLPTLFLCHDFFPLTPEIYLRSRQVTGNRLTTFSLEEVFSRGPLPLFPGFSKAEAQRCRDAFVGAISDGRVKLVAPSPSTRQLYLDLVPSLRPEAVTVIPHGTPQALLTEVRPKHASAGRLRIVIPGRFAPEKGAELLMRAIPQLAAFADILMLGCGLEGQYFSDLPGVQIVARYRPDELGEILRRFEPHLGLLVSDFPETFSYTLDELMTLAVPPVAVRNGAFADRIRHGENGFLTANEAPDVVSALRMLDRDRALVERVHRTLAATSLRTEQDMVSDYESLLGLARFSIVALDAPRQLPTNAFAHLLEMPPVGEGSPFVKMPVRRARSQAMAAGEYQSLLARVRRRVDAELPVRSIVAVVSKGDPRLLLFREHRGCHFPQDASGAYTGHHPADSAEAIRYVQKLLAGGADYLLFPCTAFWWFEYYREFKQYLDASFHEIGTRDADCAIYALRIPPKAITTEGDALLATAGQS